MKRSKGDDDDGSGIINSEVAESSVKKTPRPSRWGPPPSSISSATAGSADKEFRRAPPPPAIATTWPEVPSTFTNTSPHQPQASSVTPKRGWGQGLASTNKRSRVGWGHGLMRSTPTAKTENSTSSDVKSKTEDEIKSADEENEVKEVKEEDPKKPMPSSDTVVVTSSEPSLPTAPAPTQSSPRIVPSQSIPAAANTQAASPRIVPFQSIPAAAAANTQASPKMMLSPSNPRPAPRTSTLSADQVAQRESLLANIEKIDKQIADAEDEVKDADDNIAVCTKEIESREVLDQKDKPKTPVTNKTASLPMERVLISMDPKLKVIFNKMVKENYLRAQAADAGAFIKPVLDAKNCQSSNAGLVNGKPDDQLKESSYPLIMRPQDTPSWSENIRSFNCKRKGIKRRIFRKARELDEGVARAAVEFVALKQKWNKSIASNEMPKKETIKLNQDVVSDKTNATSSAVPLSTGIDENQEDESECKGETVGRSSSRVANAAPSDVIRSEYEQEQLLKVMAEEDKRSKRLSNCMRSMPKMEWDSEVKLFSMMKSNNNSRLQEGNQPAYCAAERPLEAICSRLEHCNCARVIEWKRSLVNPWTDLEKCIFVDKFLQYPKNFWKIATFLRNKRTSDVIEYYYLSKKRLDYKGMLREQQHRRRGGPKTSWTWCLGTFAALSLDIKIPQTTMKALLKMNRNPPTSVAESYLDLTQLIDENTYSAPLNRFENYYGGTRKKLSSSNRKTSSKRQSVVNDLYTTSQSKLGKRTIKVVEPNEKKDKSLKKQKRLDKTIDMKKIKLKSGSSEGEVNLNHNTEIAKSISSVIPNVEVAPQTKRVVQKWTEAEKADFLHFFSIYGKDWGVLTSQIGTKTPNQIKNYYQNYKNRLGLAEILLARTERMAANAAVASNGQSGAAAPSFPPTTTFAHKSEDGHRLDSRGGVMPPTAASFAISAAKNVPPYARMHSGAANSAGPDGTSTAASHQLARMQNPMQNPVGSSTGASKPHGNLVPLTSSNVRQGSSSQSLPLQQHPSSTQQLQMMQYQIQQMQLMQLQQQIQSRHQEQQRQPVGSPQQVSGTTGESYSFSRTGVSSGMTNGSVSSAPPVMSSVSAPHSDRSSQPGVVENKGAFAHHEVQQVPLPSSRMSFSSILSRGSPKHPVPASARDDIYVKPPFKSALSESLLNKRSDAVAVQLNASHGTEADRNAQALLRAAEEKERLALRAQREAERAAVAAREAAIAVEEAARAKNAAECAQLQMQALLQQTQASAGSPKTNKN